MLSENMENKNANQFKPIIVVYLIETPADITPDYEGNLLHIKLHHLSTPAYNRAAKQVAELFNESQAVLPGTGPRATISSLRLRKVGFSVFWFYFRMSTNPRKVNSPFKINISKPN